MSGISLHLVLVVPLPNVPSSEDLPGTSLEAVESQGGRGYLYLPNIYHSEALSWN